LSAALNLRRCAFDVTSGSGELVSNGTAIFDSSTIILLAALLCNYGLGLCLIDVGTGGSPEAFIDFRVAPRHAAAEILLDKPRAPLGVMAFSKVRVLVQWRSKTLRACSEG
jgi:hypothetical protein